MRSVEVASRSESATLGSVQPFEVTMTSAVPSRQQERSDLSTHRLLEAAGELIAERGYVGMTLAAVGERAGYSRGLVTIRFGSKANLLAALVKRITTGWSHRNFFPQTEGKSGLDAFLEVILAISRQFERDPHSIRLLYALMFEALGPNEELKHHFVVFHRRQRADMADILRSGIRDHSIRSETVVDDEAVAIITGLRGIAYQWLLDPDGFPPIPALLHLHETTDRRLRSELYHAVGSAGISAH
jgi:AcrR family transcriptional regulator